MYAITASLSCLRLGIGSALGGEVRAVDDDVVWHSAVSQSRRTRLPTMLLMIRAVLWDFGGVILTSPFEAFRRYEIEHGPAGRLHPPSQRDRSAHATPGP